MWFASMEIQLCTWANKYRRSILLEVECIVNKKPRYFEVFQVAFCRVMLIFNTSGNTLYSIKLPVSFQLSALHLQMNHSETVGCTMNFSSVPDVLCKTAAGMMLEMQPEI